MKQTPITELDRKLIAAAASGRVMAPTGPILRKFDPEKLADAILAEALLYRHMPNAKISLHMDIADAVTLANLLLQRSGS